MSNSKRVQPSLLQNLLDSNFDMLDKLLQLIVLSGLILYLVFYLFNAYVSIIYPYDIDYGEGFVLYQSYLLSQGKSPYQDIAQYPHFIANYPPVFPLISAMFIKLFGVSFRVRIVSLLSAILIGVLIYLILQKETNRAIALFFSLFFFASPPVYYWTRLLRVDTLALLFGLAGVYIVFKYESNRKVYLSIPFFLLAVYTKQSFFVAPMASFLYLGFKDKKLALKNFFLFLFSASSLFLLLNWLTNGQFYLHTVAYNVNSFSFYGAVRAYFQIFKMHSILFGLASAYTLWVISKRKRSLFVIYFILAALAAFSVGKVGSNTNYFVELIVLLCILSGLCVHNLKLQMKRNNIVKPLIFILLIIQLLLFVHAPYLTPGTPTESWFRSGQRLSSYVKNANDPIFSEYVGFLVVNGKLVIYQPLFSFTQLEYQGVWNHSHFINELKDKRYSLVILGFDIYGNEYRRSLFTDKILNVIRDNYHLLEKVGGFYIYTPN